MTFFNVAKSITMPKTFAEADWLEAEKEFEVMQKLLDKQEQAREYAWNVEGLDE